VKIIHDNGRRLLHGESLLPKLPGSRRYWPKRRGSVCVQHRCFPLRSNTRLTGPLRSEALGHRKQANQSPTKLSTRRMKVRTAEGQPQTIGGFNTRDERSPRLYSPSMDCWGFMSASTTGSVITNHYAERPCPKFCLHLRLVGKWKVLHTELFPRELPIIGRAH